MKKGILFVLTAAFLASCQQEENEPNTLGA